MGLACLALAVVVPAQEEGDADDDAPPRIFLDKSPRIVAFQLGRLSNAQLVRVERKADDPKYRPVHEAILARPGLERKHREEALAALAAINKTGLVPEILAAAARVDEVEESDGGVVHDLVHVLGMQPREALTAERANLEELAAGAKKPLTRRLACAGIVQADGTAERAWEALSKGEKGLVDLLGAVPMLHDASLRAGFRSRALPLLDSGDSETRRAAIEALGEIRSEVAGEEEAVFTALAALVRKGIEREAAVRALRRIPPTRWPAAPLDGLAAAVIDSIRVRTAEERTSPGALEAMELGRAIADRLQPERGSRLRKEIAALGVRVVLIKTVPHQMLFDRRFFAVDAAKPVEIVFENPDIMPHNFVIVIPGALAEVGQQADGMQLTSDPSALQFVPPGGKVLHATRLLAPGERLKLSFVAPKEPGNYPFVCTFPGHWRRMYGTMVVVPDVEAWLAEGPAGGREPPDPLGNTRKLVKEWQPEDFASDLTSAPRGRSFESGKKLLEEASCISCHPFQGKGGAVGPELSDAFQRWKQNRADLLLQILDPARTVEEKYRTHVVQTRDGFIHVGVIVAEDEKAISIVTNPQSPVPQAIPKGRIARRSQGEGSLMPIGLLNNFTKEEVLEILAYMESGGNPASEVYKGAHAGH